ncbi:unnamed protein product, partial [Phaeothamnion confervicola]
HAQCYAAAQLEALVQIVTGQAEAAAAADFAEDDGTEGEVAAGEVVRRSLLLAELLVPVLWTLLQSKALRDWEAVLGLLAKDVGDKAGEPLEDDEQTVLIKLLVGVASQLKKDAAGD